MPFRFAPEEFDPRRCAVAESGDRGALLQPGSLRVGSVSNKTKKRQQRVVADWLYTERVCCFTKAGFIWFSNVLCALAHLSLLVWSVYAATRNGKGMDTPRLTLYTTDLRWVANTSDALVPYNKPVDGLYLVRTAFAPSSFAQPIKTLLNRPRRFSCTHPISPFCCVCVLCVCVFDGSWPT